MAPDLAPTLITDEELTAWALAADPDALIERDAIPFVTHDDVGLLPAWYMPGPALGAPKGWHIPVVAVIIGALTLITGLGLCITYGTLVVA